MHRRPYQFTTVIQFTTNSTLYVDGGGGGGVGGDYDDDEDENDAVADHDDGDDGDVHDEREQSVKEGLTRRLLVGDFVETILKHLVQMEMFVVARGHLEILARVSDSSDATTAHNTTHG